MRELTVEETRNVNGGLNLNWSVVDDILRYWNTPISDIWLDIATAPGSANTAQRVGQFAYRMGGAGSLVFSGAYFLGGQIYDRWLSSYTEFWDATFSTIEVTATRIAEQGSQILQNFSVENSHYPAGYADPYNFVGGGGWGFYGDNSGFFGHRH